MLRIIVAKYIYIIYNFSTGSNSTFRLDIDGQSYPEEVCFIACEWEVNLQKNFPDQFVLWRVGCHDDEAPES